MIDCVCGYGKNLKEDQKNCPICGTDLTPLHRLRRLKEAQTKEISKIAFLKKLLLIAPIATFLIGLIIFPFLQYFITQLNTSSKNYQTLAEEIKKNIENYPDLANLNISITHTNAGLTISGEVPTELHKSLIMEILKNVAANHPVDTNNLRTLSILQKLRVETQFQYVVRKGDSLSSIAVKFYDDVGMWKIIYEANADKITDPDRIFIGQVLSIPNR